MVTLATLPTELLLIVCATLDDADLAVLAEALRLPGELVAAVRADPARARRLAKLARAAHQSCGCYGVSRALLHNCRDVGTWRRVERFPMTSVFRSREFDEMYPASIASFAGIRPRLLYDVQIKAPAAPEVGRLVSGRDPSVIWENLDPRSRVNPDAVRRPDAKERAKLFKLSKPPKAPKISRPQALRTNRAR